MRIRAPQCRLCECGDHAFAPATRWAIVLVSVRDRHLLDNFSWALLCSKPGHFYARSVLVAKEIGGAGYLHRAIIRRHPLVDHKDGNGLDCRRANLRPASRAQNKANCHLPATAQSGYFGVHKNSSGRGPPWKSAIKVDRVKVHLGYFDDVIAAAKAYDAAAKIAFEGFAVLNFPRGTR